MSPKIPILGLLLSLLLSAVAQDQLRETSWGTMLMGSRFTFTAVSDSDTLAWQAIRAAETEVKRIEALISSWNPNSQTSAINDAAGIHAVKVDPELLALIRRSIKVSELTRGAFDISFAGMESLWSFDGGEQQMPGAEELARSVAKVNYRDIVLSEVRSTVFLRNMGMRIGFGGIGKGYAANRAKLLMLEMGIRSGIVNAGGDLIAWGRDENGKPWTVVVSDPSDPNRALLTLEVDGLAVVTSGNYEKYVWIDGVRYAHIIDPRTGYPVTGIKSVSVICPDAELADALATSVFVMGKTEGLKLIEQLEGIEVVIYTEENELILSSGLPRADPVGRMPKE